jgi:hypothetical protein
MSRRLKLELVSFDGRGEPEVVEVAQPAGYAFDELQQAFEGFHESFGRFGLHPDTLNGRTTSLVLRPARHQAIRSLKLSERPCSEQYLTKSTYALKSSGS